MPSQPLLVARHVHQMLEWLQQHYVTSANHIERRELAQAGFATAALWLGWLRSGELFERTFADAMVIEPCDHGTVDLPTGVGMVTINLGIDTKGHHDLCKDVVMAYCSYSGIPFGRWFHCLCTTSSISNPLESECHVDVPAAILMALPEPHNTFERFFL